MIGGYGIVNEIAVRDGSTIRMTDNTTSANTTYYYSVRAFKEVNGTRYYSDFSGILIITTR
jgi:hypothetical protein